MALLNTESIGFLNKLRVCWHFSKLCSPPREVLFMSVSLLPCDDLLSVCETVNVQLVVWSGHNFSGYVHNVNTPWGWGECLARLCSSVLRSESSSNSQLQHTD
jgi:hypothetical protein